MWMLGFVEHGSMHVDAGFCGTWKDACGCWVLWNMEGCMWMLGFVEHGRMHVDAGFCGTWKDARGCWVLWNMEGCMWMLGFVEHGRMHVDARLYGCCDVLLGTYFLHLFQVKPDTVIEVWKAGHDSRAAVTKAGLKAIYSACWYLNLFSYGADWGKVRWLCEVLLLEFPVKYFCEQVGGGGGGVELCCPYALLFHHLSFGRLR